MISALQSALNAAGPQAGRIAGLLWGFVILLGAIFIAVMAVTLWALLRRRDTEREAGHDTRVTRTVTGATIATVVILFGLLIASVSTGKAISGMGGQNALVVELTGNQWWWSVRYPNSDPSMIVVTANEIHIPVGRPVMIKGTSHDVIHSFWVPNLHGKRDLIPSRTTIEWIQASRQGRYRGQCAEFCGLQHAHMALWVIAEPQDQFDAWVRHQLQPGASPSDPDKQRGQQVFLNNACVFCHAITGTPAAGQVGPDLTHLASRMTIAAGTLPNNKGNLGSWILDPQNIKPGNHMATINIKPEDLQPLLDYLESLQ